MNWRKLGKALLFPPVAVMIVLLPVATVYLVCSMVFLGTESPVTILSYVLAAYTLTVWCCRIPYFVRLIKAFKSNNKYLQIWRNNPRLEMNVSLYGTLIWNTAYAALQLGLGFRHRTFWFYSLAGYYIALAVMRFFLVRRPRRHKPGGKLREELIKYRACGIVFLVMNLAIALITFFMVYWNRTFIHHEITTIAMAAYTFTSLTLAIVNMIRYRRHSSPVHSASRAINLAAACVSMLTLESTMLTTFGDGSVDDFTRKMLLGTTGGVISAFIIVMAVYMIVQSNKKLKALQQ